MTQFASVGRHFACAASCAHRSPPSPARPLVQVVVLPHAAKCGPQIHDPRCEGHAVDTRPVDRDTARRRLPASDCCALRRGRRHAGSAGLPAHLASRRGPPWPTPPRPGEMMRRATCPLSSPGSRCACLPVLLAPLWPRSLANAAVDGCGLPACSHAVRWPSNPQRGRHAKRSQHFWPRSRPPGRHAPSRPACTSQPIPCTRTHGAAGGSGVVEAWYAELVPRGRATAYAVCASAGDDQVLQLPVWRAGRARR